MHIEKLLNEVLPNVDADLVKAAVRELRDPGCFPESAVNASVANDIAAKDERIKELEDELASHRREINRLQTVIVNQRAGFENASPAALGVLAERARQKRMEGYDDGHDNEHLDFELSRAAAAYLVDAIDRARGGEGYNAPPSIWPWDVVDWKRKPVYRQLEIVCALIIADQERLNRNGLDTI
jgi:uncharacterized coiled-coil protein SlyX|nr:hypothetical protein [Neorhizobium tomejilense]